MLGNSVPNGMWNQQKRAHQSGKWNVLIKMKELTNL